MRTILVIAAVAAMIAAASMAVVRPPAPQPIHDAVVLPGIDPDSARIVSGNLRASVTTPVKRVEPVLTGTRDGIFSPYLSVHRNGDAWTAYVSVADLATDSPRLARATSADGIAWSRPDACVTPPTGFGGDVVYRNGRWHYAYWNRDGDWYGTFLTTSEDGLVFSEPRRLWYHDHDITSLSHDGERWMLMYSRFPGGDQPRRSHWASSYDGYSWQSGGMLTVPSAWDEGQTQFYGVDGWITRGPYRIGLVKVMRDDVTAPGEDHPGIGWTELIVSRDGGPWRRIAGRWLEPTAGSWDCTHAWGDEQVVVGDTTRLYYGGYGDGHKGNRRTSRSIGVAEFPSDRYVALAGDGVVDVGPLRPGGKVEINGDGCRSLSGDVVPASGVVRVEVRGSLWAVYSR